MSRAPADPGDRDEFYVGYLHPAPPGLARRLRRIVWAIGLGASLLAGLIGALQREQPTGVYEFGTKQKFEGVLFQRPIPFLRVASTNVPLVGQGKHGVPPALRGHDGERVAFEGRLIHRERATLIEVGDPGTIRLLGAAGPGDTLGPAEVIGEVDLTGELVDTKCFLGVMRPATGKVHRACAVRCLSGGVPPGLLVPDASGDATVLFLAGGDGVALDIDPQLAARILRVRGRLELHDGLALLRVRTIGVKS